MNNRINLQKCCDLLLESDNILIICHKSPDGDTIGSAYGLFGMLKLLGKKAKIVCNDNIPQKYSYFTDNIVFDEFIPQFVVTVDVADSSLLGENLCEYVDKIDLAIDHHISHKDFAKNIFLNSNSAANTQNIFEISKIICKNIDKNIVNALFTGLSTDTGCFKYPNTNVETHIAAADLISLGADSAMINKLMFDTKSKAKLALEKLVMEKLEFYFDDKCALVAITEYDMIKSGANTEDFEGISALPRLIEGVEVGVTMRQKDDGFKISMRSNNYVNVSQLCSKLGGGGHIRAAGCIIKDDLDNAKKIILDLIKVAI